MSGNCKNAAAEQDTMKDARAEKRKADLDRIEAELCRLLKKKHLPGAMDRGCLYFSNSEYKPPKWDMPERYIQDYQEELLQLAK